MAGRTCLLKQCMLCIFSDAFTSVCLQNSYNFLKLDHWPGIVLLANSVKLVSFTDNSISTTFYPVFVFHQNMFIGKWKYSQETIARIESKTCPADRFSKFSKFSKFAKFPNLSNLPLNCCQGPKWQSCGHWSLKLGNFESS